MNGPTNAEKEMAERILDILLLPVRDLARYRRDGVYTKIAENIIAYAPEGGVMWIEKPDDYGEYGYAKIVPTLSFENNYLLDREDAIKRIATIIHAQRWVWV